ncbi:pentapeptide repeat-containing protein [Chitinophaga sp. Mgbs1]|uniref:Pentapeptide repeat-containing protein n=1 Tax=Chitinophaga solisilvae TaxID=1233460 RepID=A0A9Q5CZK7_9BACT|nr:pentapeptide repeat-containing protein [Chitinophaga solisilvae]
MFSPDESYEHQEFKQLTLDGTIISGCEFFACTFYKCSFKECVFTECMFEKCTFEDCDLSLIQLQRTGLVRVTIKNSKAIGVAWSNAKDAFSVAFHDTRLSFGTFSGKNLKQGIFLQCQADEVDFSDCNLSQSDFRGTDLSAARFVNCDLTQANFVGATRYHLIAAENKLRKAKFSLPEAVSLLYELGIEIAE